MTSNYFKSKKSVTPIDDKSIAVERSLQTLIEMHSEVFPGVKLLGSEYETGKTHGGHIDTLVLDENNSPAITEYKRSLYEVFKKNRLLVECKRNIKWHCQQCLSKNKGDPPFLVFGRSANSAP